MSQPRLSERTIATVRRMTNQQRFAVCSALTMMRIALVKLEVARANPELDEAGLQGKIVSVLHGAELGARFEAWIRKRAAHV